MVILTTEDGDAEKREYNKKIWRKYPEKPKMEGLQYLNNMMENLIYRNRMEANQFTDQLEDELDDQVI